MLSKQFLLKQKQCCGKGCLMCPYIPRHKQGSEKIMNRMGYACINMQLSNLFEEIFEEPSPGPIKKILSETWEEVGEPLLPITSITPELANKIRGFYKKIKEN